MGEPTKKAGASTAKKTKTAKRVTTKNVSAEKLETKSSMTKGLPPMLQKIVDGDVSVGRVLLVAVIGIVILTIVFSLLSATYRSVTSGFGVTKQSYPSSAPGMPAVGGYGGAYNSGGDDGYAEEMAYDMAARSIAPTPYPEYATGDAEGFEIKEYSGSIKTRNLDRVCGLLEQLKPYEYVVFEEASHGKYNCYYRFKVENDYAADILSQIEALNPEELNARTSSIKRRVDNYTNELEILMNDLAATEVALQDAQTSYDELQVLATNAQDIETLSTIIDNKVRLINQLTQKRLQTKQQIDRLEKAKEDQLDRLKYTFFSISVYEFELVDGKAILDSWEHALKQFVTEFNRTLQEATVGLAGNLIKLVLLALYFVIGLFVVKYGWRYTKAFWKK